MSAVTYPMHVEASLDAPLSRWLWLVKWFLAIPHYVVLAFLWVGFVVMSLVAFVAILVTGSYPRSVFEFNVGVLRWTWRVQYYTYGALGTDRYPPFTLADVPDYPARLEVDYPARLSRGLVLVKWWLLALPHYLVVGLFVGTGTWALAHWLPGGLIGVLVLVAAVVLLFTGRYPKELFDLVLGLNRWCLRVAAYAGLMTDVYPPFRLDMGGSDPDGRLAVTADVAPTPVTPAPVAPAPVTTGSGWTNGRIASAVAGGLLTLVALGLLAGGGVLLGVDRLARDGGYVTSGTRTYATAGYAVVSDTISIGDTGPSWLYASRILDKVRVRVTPDTARPVFVGIGPAAAVATYLDGVDRLRVSDLTSRHATRVAGTSPASTPTATKVFTSYAAGPGQQTLVWPVRGGDWTLVVMNADGARAVAVHADIGATVPALPWIAAALLAGGVVVLAGGVALIAVPAARAGR
jgi:hypothetical protein